MLVSHLQHIYISISRKKSSMMPRLSCRSSVTLCLKHKSSVLLAANVLLSLWVLVSRI